MNPLALGGLTYRASVRVTVAVCLHCGELKHGAFNRCPQCGYEPDDDESLTKHLLVTDHFHDLETLKAIATRVKSGESIQFDPGSLKEAWVSKAEMDAERRRIGRGCMVALGIIVASIIALLMYLVRK